jgi:hypothetical protein
LAKKTEKTKIKIKIKKEDLLPRERAPILPSKKIEDKRDKRERREKHKKDPRRLIDE